MSEEKAVAEEERTAAEKVFDALSNMSADSLAALRGALHYVFVESGREVCDVELREIQFNADEDGCVRIVARLV